MIHVLDTNTVSAVMKSDAAVLKRLKKSNGRDVLLSQPAHPIANAATLVTSNLKHMTGVPDLFLEDWAGESEVPKGLGASSSRHPHSMPIGLGFSR